MTIGGGPGGPGDTEAVGTEPGQDPLAGLTRPTGNVEAVQQAGKAYEAAGHELGYVSHRLKGMVDGVVGGAWIGKAGASCQAAVGDVASAHAEAGALTHDAAAALQKCAAQWQQALNGWKQARHVADDVVHDETLKRRELQQQAEQLFAAGNELDARLKLAEAQTYEDPRRDQVWQKANAAVGAFDDATWDAARTLDNLLMPMAGLLSKISDVVSSATTGVEAIGHLAGVSRWTKHAGPLAPVVGIFTSGYERYYVDRLKYPNMDPEERITRAIVEGATVVGGSILGTKGIVKAANKFLSLGRAGKAGTAEASGTAGDAAGGWIDRHNDPAVDAAGNFVDSTQEWLQDRVSRLYPWD